MSDNMTAYWPCLAILAVLAIIEPTLGYTPEARWGQAATILGNTLYVHGGKVDPYNAYTYSSAPGTNDLLSLDLSSSFDVRPTMGICQRFQRCFHKSRAVRRFHSLTAFDERSMLLFGGDGGPPMPLPSGSDSAWLLNISGPNTPTWIKQPEGWASEPMRSIRHSAASSFGRVWIIGGEKSDGSNLPVDGNYVFHHLCRLLTYSQSTMHRLFLLDIPHTLWFVDTSLPVPVWTTSNASGDVPTPRREFACTVLGDGRVFLHGGADATLQTVYSDAAILDVSRTPMRWSTIGGFEEIGARRNHMAVASSPAVTITPNPPTRTVPQVSTRSDGVIVTVSQPVSQPINTQIPITSGVSSHVSAPGPIPTRSQSSPPHSTRSHSSGTPSSTASPSPTENTDGPSSNLTKIAISAVIAVVVLVGLVLCGAYIALRRRRPIWRRGDGTARLISGESGPSGAHEGYGADEPKGVPVVNSSWQALQPPEGNGHFLDIREFGYISASRTDVRRNGSVGSGRSTWGDIVNASASSLRVVSAALGIGQSPRQSSYSATPPTAHNTNLREKNVSDRFSTHTIVARGQGPVRVPQSHVPDSTNDPLLSRSEGDQDGLRSPPSREELVSAFRQQDLEDHGHYDDSIIPTSFGTYGLAALGRPHSSSDLGHSSGSVSSINATILGNGSATVVGSTSSHDHHSISLLNATPSAPIRRSDSWWSRFSKGSVRGDRNVHHDGFSVVRRLSRSSDRPPKPDPYIDFRDPAPPPIRTMAPIRESRISPDASPAEPPLVRPPSVIIGSVGAHRRSSSSLVTVQTADSAALEQMGQLDIIQRVRTASTHHTQSASQDTNSDSIEETSSARPSRRPRLSIVPGSPSKTSAESRQETNTPTPSLSEDHGTIVTSPTEITSVGHSSPIKLTAPLQARPAKGMALWQSGLQIMSDVCLRPTVRPLLENPRLVESQTVGVPGVEFELNTGSSSARNCLLLIQMMQHHLPLEPAPRPL
ncbi:Galactose oxidase, central domain [Rhizoctonia solani]|uniref:Galactose oxidase, central domain n=1 Tax=Rhizoctonia solani TaxID=456999 RepID=A0A8H7IF07_9AGAM|nr:Galactose oxidase, central domain [Rhizoctonia solani]